MKPTIIVVITLLILPIYGCQPTTELPTPDSVNSNEQSQSEYVIFTDKNLEAAIRNALFIEGVRSNDKVLASKPLNEAITRIDLAKLTIVEAAGGNIVSLEGLEHCIKLKELCLPENQLTDIHNLSSLINLTKLNLGVNKISDISPLASLSRLTVLDLYVNRIEDISPLSSLKSLTNLYLFRNQISDISPLANLVNLAELDIYANRISDISPLLENVGLVAGDVVRLAGNNLDMTEGSKDMEDIEALRDKGVVVVLE